MVICKNVTMSHFETGERGKLLSLSVKHFYTNSLISLKSKFLCFHSVAAQVIKEGAGTRLCKPSAISSSATGIFVTSDKVLHLFLSLFPPN